MAIIQNRTCTFCIVSIALADDSPLSDPSVIYDKARDGSVDPLRLRPGRYRIALRPFPSKGCGSPLTSGTVTLEAGHRYFAQETSPFALCGLFPAAVWLEDDRTGHVILGKTQGPAKIRVSDSAEPVTTLETGQKVYQVRLSVEPSLAWRTAFLAPGPHLTTDKYSPAGIEIRGATILLTSSRWDLYQWLKHIHLWTEYANSKVGEVSE